MSSILSGWQFCRVLLKRRESWVELSWFEYWSTQDTISQMHSTMQRMNGSAPRSAWETMLVVVCREKGSFFERLQQALLLKLFSIYGTLLWGFQALLKWQSIVKISRLGAHLCAPRAQGGERRVDSRKNERQKHGQDIWPKKRIGPGRRLAILRSLGF